MKLYKLLLLFFILISGTLFSQERGIIIGKVLDAEMNNETLPFANVFIKGTITGATSDLDGIYTINVNPGTYTVVFSFIGYQDIEIPNIKVIAGEGVYLDDLYVDTTTSGDDLSVTYEEVL